MKRTGNWAWVNRLIRGLVPNCCPLNNRDTNVDKAHKSWDDYEAEQLHILRKYVIFYLVAAIVVSIAFYGIFVGPVTSHIPKYSGISMN